MQRHNVMLDEETHQAVSYLKQIHGITSASEAIRFAVREMARRSGWRSEAEQSQEPKRRRVPAAGEGS